MPPTYSTTPHYALRELQGSNLVSDIDAGFAALASDVEGAFAGYKSGTHAARLAATSVDGLLWRETDTGLLYLGIGSSTWTPVFMPGAWTALTLGTNVGTATGAYTPAARLNGDKVELSGSLTNNGTAITNGTTIFTVPAALKPASAVFLGTVQDFQSATASKAYPLQLLTASGNALAANTADGTFANSAIIPLDGLGYRLS